MRVDLHNFLDFQYKCIWYISASSLLPRKLAFLVLEFYICIYIQYRTWIVISRVYELTVHHRINVKLESSHTLAVF